MEPAEPLVAARRCFNEVMTPNQLGAAAAVEPLSDAVVVERRQGRSPVSSGCW